MKPFQLSAFNSQLCPKIPTITQNLSLFCAHQLQRTRKTRRIKLLPLWKKRKSQ
jgi:hypothetical protein